VVVVVVWLPEVEELELAEGQLRVPFGAFFWHSGVCPVFWFAVVTVLSESVVLVVVVLVPTTE
jgi:hypothetical protein